MPSSMVFFTRLKTIAMCFKLNILHDNLTGNVYEQFFFKNIVGSYQNRNPSQRIFIGIILSPKFRKDNLSCSHVLIRTELQSTTQNSFKLHHRCFYEGALKLLRRKLWKISRKLYVIEFSFKKIVRLHSTAYYRIKNPLQILFWSCRLFKDVLKLLENFQEKSCYGVPFSKLQVFKLQLLALPCMFLKFWKIPEIRVL